MKKYIDYFWRLAFTSTAKSTYITTLGAGIVAFLGFVFWIVVARSLPPADFGLFSVVFNLVTILFVLCDVGLSSSILRFLPQAIRESKEEEVKKILKLAFLAVLLVSGLLTIFLAVFSNQLAILVFTKKELSLPLLIASFSLLGIALSYLFIAIFQGKQKFLLGVITEGAMMLIKVSAVIILLLLGKLNLISLVVVFSLTSFSGLIFGFIFLGPSFLFSRLDMSLAKILLGFGLWVALARIANATSARIDALMLTRFVDSAQIGFYAAAQRMTFIFPVIVTGMTAVLSPKFASLKSVSEAKSFVKKSSLLISSLFLLVVVLFPLAPWLTILIFGEVYQPTILIFQVLLISAGFFIASTIPTLIILYYFGDPRLFAILSIGQLVIIFVGNLILIPRFGVFGPALSMATAYGIIFLVSLIFVFSKFKKNEEKE